MRNKVKEIELPPRSFVTDSLHRKPFFTPETNSSNLYSLVESSCVMLACCIGRQVFVSPLKGTKGYTVEARFKGLLI
jgi:hypothetical protein